MGFLKEVYPNNQAGLVVSFRSDAFDTDSVQEAMEHFGIYRDGICLMLRTEESKALDDIGVSPKQAADFRAKVDTLIATFDDETAATNYILFPQWSGNGVAYEVGVRVQYNDTLYKVLQAHTSQPDWIPTTAPSLFAKVLVDEETGAPKAWEQPDSTNGYVSGDVVIHNEKYWKSLVDNNIWEPGATGVTQWKQCDENGNDIIADWAAGVSYATGDVVMYNGKKYKCLRDACVWSPTDLPSAWEEVE